jgi:hypothetical protein
MVKKTPRQQLPQNSDAVRDEWIAAVDEVLSQVEVWCAEKDWWVNREDKTLAEDELGSYAIPVLRIQTPTGRLVVDPIARQVVGASGRIDLCVFPSYDFVMLVRTDKGWRLTSIEKNASDRAWSKKAFLDAVSELIERA